MHTRACTLSHTRIHTIVYKIKIPARLNYKLYILQFNFDLLDTMVMARLKSQNIFKHDELACLLNLYIKKYSD